MTSAQTYHLNSQDGTQLSVRDWRPDGPPQHQLLLVHGLGEHLGRYEGLGEALAGRGVRCLGVDLRGHGMSRGRRGHIRRWQDYVLDIAAAAEQLEAPYNLFAHSMGGLVALDFLQQHADSVRKIILSGPLVGEAVKNPEWKKKMGLILSKVLPWVPVANGIPMEDLCTDSAQVSLFENDSLRVKTITPRWYSEMLDAVERMWEYLPNYTTQMDLHVAGEERIIDRQALDRFFEQWPAEKKRWIWEGGRHEILQEPFREGVIAAIFEGLGA